MASTNPLTTREAIRRYGWEILPYLGNLGINLLANSQLLFVDSGATNASDADDYIHGHTPDKPLATIDYAVGLCTASQGDIIIVLPGHNEGITTAAEIDVDVAGVSIIGVGQGTLKPTIDFDADAASVAVGASNVTIQNIRFRCSANAITVGLDIEDGNSNVKIRDCDFGFAETATDEFAIALRTGDASNFVTVDNCLFQAGAQAAVEAILFNKDTDHTVIKNCTFTGAYSTAPIVGATTASTYLDIHHNVFMTTGSTDTFNLVAASTGCVRDNTIVVNAATFAAALDIGNCWNINNYMIADDDVGGDNCDNRYTAAASVTETADG